MRSLSKGLPRQPKKDIISQPFPTLQFRTFLRNWASVNRSDESRWKRLSLRPRVRERFVARRGQNLICKPRYGPSPPHG